MLTLEGEVRRVEPVQGNGYAYLRAYVLSGVEMYRCRLGDNYGPAPSEGQTIRAEIAGRVYSDKNDRPQLAWTLVKPADAPARSGSSPNVTPAPPTSRAS